MVRESCQRNIPRKGKMVRTNEGTDESEEEPCFSDDSDHILVRR